MPFVEFIWNYIRDTSDIFSIFSLVKISLTSFLCFSFVFRLVFLFSKHSYLCNKKKITHWLEHMKFIFSWKKDFICLLCSLVNIFSTRNKLHMFAPPCNILYISELYSQYSQNIYNKTDSNILWWRFRCQLN